MKIFRETELLINPDGSIYHLHLKPEQVANNIILVGDPQRVPVISEYFDNIEWMTQNREILSHTGYIGAKRISVISTGMGTDNIDIIMHELDALVNIDFNTRKRKDKHTALNLVRVGTSGAIQPEIPLNAYIMAEYGLGIDGLLNFYDDRENLLENDLAQAFSNSTCWPSRLARPYAVRGSDMLMKRLGDGLMRGITITAPGFYGPQARPLRIPLAYPHFMDNIESFRYNNLSIANFEMETSALYGLSKLLGHNALTICLAIANRATKQYDPGYKEKMKDLIVILLEKFKNT